MNNLLYTLAIIFVILWAIGFWGFHLGNLIHVLLVFALVALLFRIIRGANVK